jgi:hypothetical protein
MSFLCSGVAKEKQAVDAGVSVMGQITRRQRVAEAQDRVRYHIGRGRNHIRGLSHQFWQGLVTGVALCIVIILAVVILKTTS